MTTPLTVRVACPNTVTSKRAADKRYKEAGTALWLRADGKRAILFYSDGGKKRQKTFKVGRVIQAS